MKKKKKGPGFGWLQMPEYATVNSNPVIIVAVYCLKLKSI